MHWELSFKSESAQLNSAVDDAVNFVDRRGASEQGLYHVRFVLEELGTNILKYGYDDTAIHEIQFRLELEPEIIQVQLVDDGHEFDPTKLREPDTSLPLEERALGGLGIMLVRQLVKGLSYERRHGKNIITVTISRWA